MAPFDSFFVDSFALIIIVMKHSNMNNEVLNIITLHLTINNHLNIENLDFSPYKYEKNIYIFRHHYFQCNLPSSPLLADIRHYG